MAIFEISKRENGVFQFVLKASNGEIILSSESYTTKANCQNGVRSVKKNGIADNYYIKLVSDNNKYYFDLKAANGQIIGTSRMYETEQDRYNEISSLKRNVPDAVTIDLTRKRVRQ
ncbi:YegP family protein [Viscerimonas tarda]